MRRLAPAAASVVALAGALALAGCSKNPLMATVGDVYLPDCDAVIPAAAGPTVSVGPQTHEESLQLPKAPVIRIAADRGVSWRRVQGLAERIEKQGSRPVFLVGRGHTSEIVAFEPTQALQPGKHLTLDVMMSGKFCISHPDAEERYCVQSGDRLHISRPFVEQAVAKAVKGYRIHDVEVKVDPHMNWAEMVRAVDGARTCCQGTEVRASLQD